MKVLTHNDNNTQQECMIIAWVESDLVALLV